MFKSLQNNMDSVTNTFLLKFIGLSDRADKKQTADISWQI